MSDRINTLGSVDWDFPRSTTPVNTVHGLHWFPGNFIPQIPSFLIQILSVRGDLVCDPFCGSGTTGIEALRLGRRSYQSDVNCACVQIAAGKMLAFTNRNIVDLLAGVLDLLLLDPHPKHDTSYAPPAPEAHNELARWLNPATYEQLQVLWELTAATSNDVRPVLEMIFTDTLFACASVSGARTRSGKIRKHHWGWVADNVRPRDLIAHNAIDLFRTKLFRAIQTLKSDHAPADVPNCIRKADARSMQLEDNSVDLIVTSPPYLGMIDYTAANRLSYLWQGWNMEKDLSLEIGARRHRTRTNAEEDYMASMKKACQEMKRILRPGGFCAIVIGTSRKFPDAAHKMLQMFSEMLPLVWGPVARTPTRRRVSERQGRRPIECICVFEK